MGPVVVVALVVRWGVGLVEVPWGEDGRRGLREADGCQGWAEQASVVARAPRSGRLVAWVRKVCPRKARSISRPR